jgi:3-dehydroquinate synthetase
MERLEVKLGRRAYPILVGPGLLGSRELFARHAGAAKILVVTDEAVGPLWLPRLEEGLSGRDYSVCVLPGGEQQKTLGNTATARCSPSAAA